MTVRLIASAVIAALLLIGIIPSAPQNPAPAITPPEQAAEPIPLSQLEIEPDLEEPTPHYDVEYREGDWEYDFEISQTGEILKEEKEFDPIETQPPLTVPPATEPKTLTAEEAKAVALAHAGITAERVKVEWDTDGHWDVDFRDGDFEYDYEISRTGEVLKGFKEFDPIETQPPVTAPPVTEPPATEPAPAEPKTLTAEEAKAVALAHAGLTADRVRGLKAEFDLDDGVPEFEVEFYADGFEYDYEIHAANGTVLSWDKEWDD